MTADRQPRNEEARRVLACLDARAAAALAEWSSRPAPRWSARPAPGAGSERRGAPGGSTRAEDLLGLARFLRERFDAEVAREIALQHELRARATGKFPHPERLGFTRKGLEQATRRDVARWRAGRIAAHAPHGPVVDLTCGLGADSAALLAAGVPVLALEQDELVARLARHNLEVLGGARCVVQASALAPPARVEHWIADPDRRAGGTRSLDPGSWEPSPTALFAALRAAGYAGGGGCLKLAPGIEHETLERIVAAGGGARMPALPVWVSAGGELRECSLWLGAWASGSVAPGSVAPGSVAPGSVAPSGGAPGSGASAPALGEREAVRLDADGVEHALRGRPEPASPLTPEEAAAVRWIAEPDPAAIRSGLLGNLARRAGARPLAAKIAFLGSSEPIRDPLLESHRVLDACALDPRRVRRMLGEHDVGEVRVLVRGHPDPAAVLARRLAGPGSRRGTLLLARLERGHHAYLVERGD